MFEHAQFSIMLFFRLQYTNSVSLGFKMTVRFLYALLSRKKHPLKLFLRAGCVPQTYEFILYEAEKQTASWADNEWMIGDTQTPSLSVPFSPNLDWNKNDLICYFLANFQLSILSDYIFGLESPSAQKPWFPHQGLKEDRNTFSDSKERIITSGSHSSKAKEKMEMILNVDERWHGALLYHCYVLVTEQSDELEHRQGEAINMPQAYFLFSSDS